MSSAALLSIRSIDERELFTDVFEAIVDPNGPGFTPPFNDPIKAPDHPLGWQREVDLDPQASPIQIHSQDIA